MSLKSMITPIGTFKTGASCDQTKRWPACTVRLKMVWASKQPGRPSSGDVMPESLTDVRDKGLKKNAISFLSSVTIGVSSTAPAYSLAATLGPIAGFVAFGTPSVMIFAFIPMLLMAVTFYQMNRADPDCGTTFAWVSQAIGPRAGWMGGWSVIATNILVMPSLADIAGKYSFRLFGVGDPSVIMVAVAGVVWIGVITAICYHGIAFSARTQQILLAVELLILLLFAVLALVQVYGGNPPAGSHPVSLSWFNPLDVGSIDRFSEAMVLAVFIYWGWDSSVAVNEETEHPRTAPGHAAIVSTVVLVGLYDLVAVAAVAVAGPDMFVNNQDDVLAPLGTGVLGSPLDKIVVVAVLSSAVAAAQTTVLPAARMALSMAHAGALPRRFGDIHPRYSSPGFATLAMGAVSVAWYLGLTTLSADVLTDSIAALGLVVAFYYALTACACVMFYRREIFRSTRNFVSMGLIPAAGGLIMALLLIKILFTPGEANASRTSILGIGGPVVFGVGAILIGFVAMLFAQRRLPAFFRRRPTVFAAES
jgi:amino acid transporter